MNIWNNLPNAAHINWVLESEKYNLIEWNDSWTVYHDANTGDDWDHIVNHAGGVASSIIKSSKRLPFWDAAYKHINGDTSRVALLSLIAYDHASKYIDMNYTELLEVTLMKNEPAAILLLPATKARERILQKKVSSWHHLTNADYIDWILTSIKTNPDEWRTAFDAVLYSDDLYECWDDVWNDTWNYALSHDRAAVAEAAAHAASNAAADAAAISMVVYDNASKYFDMNYRKLLTWAHLSNDPMAILLLPAVKARELIDKKSRKNKRKK